MALAAALGVPAKAFDNDWKPVDSQALSLDAPAVEEHADAEAIFWEVYVKDEVKGGDPRTVLSHYLRIKIFTEKGKELVSRIDLPYDQDTRIDRIAGRTIRPDVQIVKLDEDSVFERTIIKTSEQKIRAKSFAMPGVEPGAIVEYRWREIRRDQLANYIRLELQRDIPVQQVTYCVKPITNIPYGMRYITFNGRSSPLKKEKGGYYSIKMNNVPAYREEPHMPPEYQVRPWILLFYSDEKVRSTSEYWEEVGKDFHDWLKPQVKISKEIRNKAAELLTTGGSNDERLRRLYEFCQQGIKNLDYSLDDTSGGKKKGRKPAECKETLKRGVGTSWEINALFIALARAAGFEAYLAMMADRDDIFFDTEIPESYFLDASHVAVAEGEKWRFYDPGSPHIPYGMLPWEEEGGQALICHPKRPAFVPTPLSPAEESLAKKWAELRINENGTLEGDVRVELTGHLAILSRRAFESESQAEVERQLIERLRARLGDVEIDGLRVNDFANPENPFAYSYHIRFTDYAQATGKRLFLQPAFFRRGLDPVFPNTGRRHQIYFNFKWSEQDNVALGLPVGFELDNASSPAGFEVGIASYKPVISVSGDGHKLFYTRSFSFSGMLFDTAQYPALKALFDEIHKADNHTIILKRTEEQASF
jgi:hypothetical protein